MSHFEFVYGSLDEAFRDVETELFNSEIRIRNQFDTILRGFEQLKSMFLEVEQQKNVMQSDLNQQRNEYRAALGQQLNDFEAAMNQQHNVAQAAMHQQHNEFQAVLDQKQNDFEALRKHLIKLAHESSLLRETLDELTEENAIDALQKDMSELTLRDRLPVETIGFETEAERTIAVAMERAKSVKVALNSLRVELAELKEQNQQLSAALAEGQANQVVSME